ncbi:hypothetical protein KC717_04385, partial [Candidatus Dojkabacteria bacterium]|nr:hypothetical protein [Candidatus Dojkabacteria bacterium]
QIEISKPWQHRQKIADKTIQDLTIILKDLEKKIGKPIDISWVLETGRLFVTDIREANHVNPHGFVKLSHEVLAEKTKEEKKQEKSIEEYVDEIEQEIENIEHNPVPLKEVLFDARGIAREKTEEELQPMKESKEDHNHALSSEEIKKLEPLADAIWDIQEFSPRRKLEPTVLGLWMDVKGGKAKGVVNSNSFYGLYNFNGEDAVTAFGHKISDLNEKEQEQFVEYLAEELFESASPDPAKHIMYSISMLTSQEGVDFMGMDKSGMSIHLDDQSLLRLEMDAIKTLRNKLGYRNIAVAIRGLNQLEQLWTIRKYINAYGLRQSRSFEIYVEIDSVPLFLNARDYIKEEIDGIILHVDTIVENLLGKKVTIDDILDHESFWELVEKASKEIHKEHSNFIIASRNFKKGEDLLFKFMQYGITGVILSPEEINDLRPRISKLEIDMLE